MIEPILRLPMVSQIGTIVPFAYKGDSGGLGAIERSLQSTLGCPGMPPGPPIFGSMGLLDEILP